MLFWLFWLFRLVILPIISLIFPCLQFSTLCRTEGIGKDNFLCQVLNIRSVEQWSRILKIRVKRHAKSRSLLQAQFPFVSQSSLLQVKSGGLHSLVSFCTCSSIGTEGSSFLRLFMEFSCQTLQDLNHWGVHFFSFIPLFLAFLNPLLQAVSHFLSVLFWVVNISV